MEVYLQKIVPGKKHRKPTQKASKKPALKEESVKKEKPTIDFIQRNIKSAIGLYKYKCDAKSANNSTPMVLETFTRDDLVQDTVNDSKIDHGVLPRDRATVDLISKLRRRAKTKRKTPQVSQNFKTVQVNDSEEDFDDNEDELALAVGTEEFFEEGVDLIQNDVTAEMKTDAQEIHLPFPVNVIRTKPDDMKEIEEEPYKAFKKPKGLNVQDHYKIKVPRPCNILENVCSKCKFVSFNEPRRKMPLAVIDLDTIIYFFEPNQKDYEKPTPRPFLNYFLASLYDHYDLAFWAKTSMDVLLAKLRSLEIITKKHSYKICFCLDNTSIINSYIPRLGNPIVKPLEVIWNLYEKYDKKNTILIGDQRNNYYFNTKFGLQVKKNSNQISFIKDPELIKLTAYLENAAKSGRDLSKVAVRITKTYIMTK